MSNRGTTLVELTLYVGLLSIFLLALFGLFSMILNAQSRSLSVSAVQTNANRLLHHFTYNINQADSLTTPSSIGSSAFTLALRIGTTNFTYVVQNGRLQINDGITTSNLNDVDTSVSNFLIRRLGNAGGKNSLQIGFTITSDIIGPTNQKFTSFQTTVTQR